MRARRRNVMKATKITIISLVVLLAVVLALAFVPVAEQGTAYADEVIDKVELEIDAPVNGVSALSNIAHIKDAEEDRYYVRFTNWFDITADKDLMYADDVFVGGHAYRVSVTVSIKPNLYPATQFLVSGLGNPDVTAKINGELASTKKSYSSDAKQMFVIVYEFMSTEYGEVTTVKIDGLSAPFVTQNPDYDVEIAEGECHANTNMGSKNGIVWYDPALNSIVAENNTFDLGKVYETQLNYEVEDGFYFAPGLEVYLNGEKLPSSDYSYINQFLTITKSYTCEKAQIKNVDITGIDAPTWESGNPKLPDYTATIGEDYEFLADDEHAEVGRYSGVQWWDAENDVLIENPEDTFEGNKIYKARFYLKVADPINYEFAMNGGLSAVTATVNGEVAECSPIFGYGGDYGDYLQVTYTFAPTGNTVTDIFISNFFEVEHQGHWSLRTETLATGEAYKVKNLNWYLGNQPLHEPFEFGNVYSSNINIVAEDGYVFDENLTFTINGEKIDPARIKRLEFEDEHKSLWVLVDFTCKETSINTVEANIMDPVTGEYVDETVTLKNTDECEGEVKWYLGADFDAEPLLETAHFANGQYGAKITLNAKDGFRFADGIKIIVNGGTYYASSADNKTLAAEIIMDSAASYTITFDANGGGAGTMEDLTFVKDGTVVNLPDCNFPAPDNHRFVGWSESSTGDVVGNPYTFNYAGDLTLYAIWEEYYEYSNFEINTHALVGATTAVLLSDTDIVSGNVTVVKNCWETKDGDPIVEGAPINVGDTQVYIISFQEKAPYFFPEGFSLADVDTMVYVTGDARYNGYSMWYDSIARAITVKLYFYCRDDEEGIKSNIVNVKFYTEDKLYSVDWPVGYGDMFTMPKLGEEPGDVDFDVPAGKEFVGWQVDDMMFAPGYKTRVYGDIEFVVAFKRIFKITLDFGDYGDDILLDMEGEQVWWQFECDNFYYGDTIDNLMKVGNKYLVGFAKEPVAEDADFATLKEKILYEQVIDKSCTLYAVYVTLPDQIFGVTNPSEKELSNNGSVQDAGKLTIDSYPYYYWLNDYVYYDILIEFEGGQLVGTNDNQDKLDFEIYTDKMSDFAITIGGQRMMISSSHTDGLDAFGTIAGNKEFVYIDGYGTEEEFEAVASILNGKIAVVKRGGITFAEKAGFADAAGAIGIIYVNNTDNIGYPSVDSYEGKIPCGMVTLSDGALLKSGEKKTLGGVDYYEGSFTVSAEEEEFYFNDSYYTDNNTMFRNPEEEWSAGVWVKILDPSKIKNGETYTGVITYKVKITDGFDKVTSFQKTTNLTVVGDEIEPEPEPQPEGIQPDPNYPHENVDGKEVYAQEITFGTNENVSVAFASAKAGHGVVRIDVSTLGLSILFDENAVNAIGGKDVTLNANFITPPFNAPYLGMEGLDCVFDLTLTGATFAGGSATVTIHREIEVPDGKQVKVYYLNGGEKVACATTYSDNELSFTTNHFSAFGAFIEDAPQPEPQPVDPEPQPEPEPAQPKGGLSGGAIAGIVIAVVAVLAGAGVGCFFLLKKKGIIGKGKALKVTANTGDDFADEPEEVDEPAEEPAEQPAEEPEQPKEPEEPASEPQKEEGAEEPKEE